MNYLRHPAWLWLEKNDKAKLPAIDENTQAAFDAGNLFEGYAEQIFGHGVRLGFTDYRSYLALPQQTMEALLGGETTIFQPRFEVDGLTCICDVIQVVGDKTFDLFEIKSSTSAKPEHIQDLAFQAHVIHKSGFNLRKIGVVHVNNSYVRAGHIVPEEFAAMTDVTDAVNALDDETAFNIERALETVASKDIPDISPAFARNGAFSQWLAIYKTLVDLPKDSIYDLCGLNADLVAQFTDANIQTLHDIPDDYPLTEKQRQQVLAVKLDRPIIEHSKIKEFLSRFTYPLYFLDYETLANVVPVFDGMRPYQQMPFQYSVHILDSPESELRHEEYLHREGTNPALDVATSLREHIGDDGTILSWNMSFEKGCNKTLSDHVPELKEFLLGLNDRMDDLDIPFKDLWYVDKRFKGSYSIKNILPVLAPHLSYKILGIQEGATAQRLWMQAIVEGKDHIDKEVMFADLLEYCKLDTLAMVEIFNQLRKTNIGI